VHQDAELLSPKHISSIHLSDENGKLSLILMLESRLDSDFVEIINEVLIPHFNRLLGAGAVVDTRTYRLSFPLTLLHNYTPEKNMMDGIIKSDWPDDRIFVV